jgi:hypothetical protein
MERDSLAVTASLPGESIHRIPLPVVPGDRSIVPVRATPAGWMGRSGRRVLRTLNSAANAIPPAPLRVFFIPFPPGLKPRP